MQAGVPRAVGRRLRRFLASMHLALFLILSLSIVALAGTLIDQAPLPVVSDRIAYAMWLDEARGKYGGWTDTLDSLQLFNIFHSIYFRALLGMLTLNIIVCTISRWRGIWATTFHTRPRATETFLRNAQHRATLQTPMLASEAAERLRTQLSSARYRVVIEPAPGSIAVFADKNRLSRFGTFFTHLSLVLILIGAMAGGVWGFDDPRFAVAEGSTRELGLGTNLAVRLNQFADEYRSDGSPSDFRSEVTLLEHGQVVKSGVIRVNSPMRYDGVAFHQSFFGQAVVLTVRDESGAVLFSDAVPLSGQAGEAARPAGSFTIPERDITVHVAGPTVDGRDALIRPGEVRVDMFAGNLRAVTPQNLALGTPANLAGLSFTFEREVRFAGLNVVKDPGMNIVWAACAFMVAGLVMLFYLPRRRLWALCIERPGGPVEVLLGMPAQRDATVSQEFERLTARLTHSLNATTPARPTEGELHG